MLYKYNWNAKLQNFNHYSFLIFLFYTYLAIFSRIIHFCNTLEPKRHLGRICLEYHSTSLHNPFYVLSPTNFAQFTLQFRPFCFLGNNLSGRVMIVNRDYDMWKRNSCSGVACVIVWLSMLCKNAKCFLDRVVACAKTCGILCRFTFIEYVNFFNFYDYYNGFSYFCSHN